MLSMLVPRQDPWNIRLARVVNNYREMAVSGGNHRMIL